MAGRTGHRNEAKTMSEASPKKADTPRRAGSPASRRRLFLKQPAMRRVVYALIPVAVSAVYFFGWRVLAVLAVCLAAGLTAEYVMARRRGGPISTACLVTCWLYALSLPPTVPFWIAAVGIVVAIVFAKEAFGGFGRNFANPAITGRAFVYICFPNDLTSQFVPAFKGFPGGFAQWSFRAAGELPEYIAGQVATAGRTVADAVSQASPMWVAREYGLDTVVNSGDGATIWDMMLGSIGGVFQAPGQAPRILSAGSMGEGCGLLIIAAGVYLLWTKTANWRLMLGCLLGVLVANTLFRDVLGYSGLGQVPPVQWQLFAGTTLYVTVFMVTDPVSATKRRPAQWAYAFLIGFLVVVLRWQGVFVAAATFSVLLGNMIGPLLDLGAGAWADWRKKRKAPPAAEKVGPEGKPA